MDVIVDRPHLFIGWQQWHDHNRVAPWRRLFFNCVFEFLATTIHALGAAIMPAALVTAFANLFAVSRIMPVLAKRPRVVFFPFVFCVFAHRVAAFLAAYISEYLTRFLSRGSCPGIRHPPIDAATAVPTRQSHQWFSVRFGRRTH